MRHKKHGLSLRRKKHLIMEIILIHTRLRNVCNELSYAFSEPNNRVETLLGQLEKARVHLQEVNLLVENDLPVSD